jgi:hypothetical protein
MPSKPTIAIDQMINKIEVRVCGGELTKDDRNDDDLDVLCAGFVGVS